MSVATRIVAVALVAAGIGCDAEPARLATSAIVRGAEDAPAVRFVPYAVELEVAETPIAAWQVEIVARSGRVELVGVEGGPDRGFGDAPYYDPAALMGDRIVLAAFSTEASLATGTHRVAVIHVREEGPAPEYEIRLVAAGAADGSPAVAGVDLVSVKGANR